MKMLPLIENTSVVWAWVFFVWSQRWWQRCWPRGVLLWPSPQATVWWLYPQPPPERKRFHTAPRDLGSMLGLPKSSANIQLSALGSQPRPLSSLWVQQPPCGRPCGGKAVCGWRAWQCRVGSRTWWRYGSLPTEMIPRLYDFWDHQAQWAPWAWHIQ